MDRIVDITTDNQHLAVHRGFLTVGREGQEVGRVALDDVAAVIVHANGISYSNNLLVRLAERNVLLVICAANHAPVACVWPLEGHHAQGARMRAQIGAPRPLAKQLWRQIVIAKIRMQGAIVAANGLESDPFEILRRRVRSGDPENIEAQAARRYWPLLFGPDFRRDRKGGGVNALLNYGYTVLRALVARSIVSSGLHPTLGIHHRNRTNAFALADDVMEPFRPLVDQTVLNLWKAGRVTVEAETKRLLTGIATFDLVGPSGTSPVSIAIQRLAHSLATSFEEGKPELECPAPPTLLGIARLGFS